MKYPVKCKIIEVTDIEVLPGIKGRIPEESLPHINKLGVAKKIKGEVRITLDDGTIILGEDCWWEPI